MRKTDESSHNNNVINKLDFVAIVKTMDLSKTVSSLTTTFGSRSMFLVILPKWNFLNTKICVLRYTPYTYNHHAFISIWQLYRLSNKKDLKVNYQTINAWILAVSKAFAPTAYACLCIFDTKGNFEMYRK